MSQPLISVILPLYNAGAYIESAVKSILAQTLKDFELIVIDDGSKDNSYEVVEKIADPRIILIRQENSGMAATINKGFLLAKGKFIARMDHDDISLPSRFEKQIKFLEENPSVGIVGTWAQVIDEKGKPKDHFHKHPAQNNDLKLYLLFDNPFVHSSVMLRREIIDSCGLYDVNKPALIQDFEYWSRISEKYQLANIPEVLLKYRQLGSGMSFSAENYHLTVLQQSLASLKKIPVKDPAHIESIATLYHLSTPANNEVLTLKDAEEIIINICASLGIKQSEATHKLIKNLKRKLSNYYINKKETGFISHWYYRLNRRLLSR